MALHCILQHILLVQSQSNVYPLYNKPAAINLDYSCVHMPAYSVTCWRKFYLKYVSIFLTFNDYHKTLHAINFWLLNQQPYQAYIIFGLETQILVAICQTTVLQPSQLCPTVKDFPSSGFSTL
ncbi:hypothetical protein BX070DRAFT_226638 [Coemansia spiralis]|nr:hypothetical protein BX070DRAFT_226638 [Coemansia spiralis]